MVNNCGFPHTKVKWLTISRIINQSDEIKHFWNPFYEAVDSLKGYSQFPDITLPADVTQHIKH